MLCKAPFLGMTIGPDGGLQLCCATNHREYFKTNISEISSLNEFFLGEEYEYIRDQMKADGITSIPQCAGCWGSLKGEWTEADNYNKKEYVEPLKIKYLEVTTSNICNQTCVTCGSYFSSKWRKIEKEFGREVYPSFYLSDESIEKIIETLPDLKYLQIKGGEPFADKNNLKILEALGEVNPACELIITSNFQNIPKEWYIVLSKLKNIKAGASIDGVHKNYDWIRGGKFEETVATMEDFYRITGSKILVNVCVSLYNIFALSDIEEYFSNKDYVRGVIFNNIVTYPEHLSINLLKKSKIIRAVNLFNDKFSNIRMIDGTVRPDPALVEKFYQHSSTMNKIRGSNIFDIQPELCDIFK